MHVDDLESEMSALQKKLIQQTEKYDHDMAMITQVCNLDSLYTLFVLHLQHTSLS